MKNHLAGTHNEVCKCPQVSEEVKDYFLEYLKGKNKKKAANLECFDEEEDVGVNSKSMGTMDAYVTKGKKKEKQLTLNEMCVLPLVKVLWLVDGDSKPAMGYIYEAMDRAKEQIAKNLGEQRRRYEKIWNVIDTRWDYQLHRPAAYYLNPKFQYSETFKADREVRKGLYTTIERMYPDMDTRIIIDEQLEKFKNAEGMFGMEMAKLTRDKKQPGKKKASELDDEDEIEVLDDDEVIELEGEEEEEEEEFDEATMADDNDDDDVEELDLEDD
ncbi:hypothetical protein RHMOL_Rhmol11G0083700 [Rhododendron molle]|uniref:Uncharacterized protein n=1 Tax=Rhododendron molle TaxID=49168 RepID=A0ACC0LPM8_RHOML|nr:hypothetical protein RHMOL_Rhmol11G0083700 [Rhododendron molle]